MIFNLIATIKTKGPVRDVNTKSGSKSAMDIILEVKEGEYTNEISMTAWGQTVNEASKISEGTEVKVGFTIRSMKSNSGYWNTYLSLVSAEPVGVAAPAPKPVASAQEETDEDLPF